MEKDKESKAVLAANVRALRQGAGLTQSELAELAGLSRSAIATIEGGRYASADLSTLEALARALNVTVDMLRTEPKRTTLSRYLVAFLASPWAAAVDPTEDEKRWIGSLPEIVFFGSEPTPETIAGLIQWRRGARK